MTIKYCIWDVGKTIYDYSLDPLDKMMRSKTSDVSSYDESGGVYKYNFDQYMKGEVSFPLLCQDLCRKYNVEFTNDMPARINKAFHEGVGEYYPETKKAMIDMKNAGVRNCILSNALPVLKDTGNVYGLVDRKNVFCSFSMGFLKPDPTIFQCVELMLDCEPNEILFIDDKEKNTAAAAKLGFNTITYRRETIAEDIKKYIPKNVRRRIRNYGKSR